MKKILILIALAVIFASCKVATGNAAAELIVQSIKPNLLSADVDDGFDDKVVVAVQAVLRNPSEPIVTTELNVIVDQIDVTYFRSDGQNVPGQDVPYGYSMRWNKYLIANEAAVDLENVVILRHVAKLEPPLIDLLNLGQEKIFTFYARMTFHAKDIRGHRLDPVTADMTIQAANFAGEE